MIRLRTTCLSLLLCSFALLLVLAVPAPPAAAEDRDQAIRDTILGQILAFANDDQDTAWDYASDRIKRYFRDSDTFMAMVRERYPAVYGATNIEFSRRVPHGSFEIQVVRLKGPEGQVWDAYYRMVQNDETWKIGGVRLQPADMGI